MKTLRWIAFLPISIIAISLNQLLNIIAISLIIDGIKDLGLWTVLLIAVFLGIAIILWTITSYLGFLTTQIAPNRRIGGSIISVVNTILMILVIINRGIEPYNDNISGWGWVIISGITLFLFVAGSLTARIKD